MPSETQFTISPDGRYAQFKEQVTPEVGDPYVVRTAVDLAEVVAISHTSSADVVSLALLGDSVAHSMPVSDLRVLREAWLEARAKAAR